VATSRRCAVIRNLWGEFLLRAYVLQGSIGTGERCHGVTIEKKMPIEVRMLQKVKALPLSNTQREVCYLRGCARRGTFGSPE
jgi:hypothetical protein